MAYSSSRGGRKYLASEELKLLPGLPQCSLGELCGQPQTAEILFLHVVTWVGSLCSASQGPLSRRPRLQQDLFQHDRLQHRSDIQDIKCSPMRWCFEPRPCCGRHIAKRARKNSEL